MTPDAANNTAAYAPAEPSGGVIWMLTTCPAPGIRMKSSISKLSNAAP